MKKILTPIITIIFSIGVANNAMAQNILKPQPKEEVTANLMFSPFIKIFGCVLKINETFIHLKDITSYTITPVDKHDVRGKLSIATYGNTINAKSTVNNLNEFNRFLFPTGTIASIPIHMRTKKSIIKSQEAIVITTATKLGLLYLYKKSILYIKYT